MARNAKPRSAERSMLVGVMDGTGRAGVGTCASTANRAGSTSVPSSLHFSIQVTVTSGIPRLAALSAVAFFPLLNTTCVTWAVNDGAVSPPRAWICAAMPSARWLPNSDLTSINATTSDKGYARIVFVCVECCKAQRCGGW